MPANLPANPTGGAEYEDVNVNRCCLVLKDQLNITIMMYLCTFTREAHSYPRCLHELRPQINNTILRMHLPTQLQTCVIKATLLPIEY